MNSTATTFEKHDDKGGDFFFRKIALESISITLLRVYDFQMKISHIKIRPTSENIQIFYSKIKYITLILLGKADTNKTTDLSLGDFNMSTSKYLANALRLLKSIGTLISIGWHHSKYKHVKLQFEY